jgi:hypothetical protein
MVLDGEDRELLVPETLHRTVVQIPVGDLQIRGPGEGPRRGDIMS